MRRKPMKFRKIGSLFFAAVCMMFLLAGCSSVKFNPTETSIFVKKDGTVVSADIEEFNNSQFDTPRYYESELTAFIEEAVLAYNTETANKAFTRADQLDNSKETLPVAIQQIKVEENMATLILDYAKASDYLAFNEDVQMFEELIIGHVSDGVSSGLDFAGMKNADGSDADVEKLKSNDKYSLVSVTGAGVVKVEGKVVYMSSGVTLKDENTVVTTEGTSYIIFK